MGAYFFSAGVQLWTVRVRNENYAMLLQKKKWKKGKIKEHSQHALGLNLNLNLFKVNQ